MASEGPISHVAKELGVGHLHIKGAKGLFSRQYIS